MLRLITERPHQVKPRGWMVTYLTESGPQVRSSNVELPFIEQMKLAVFYNLAIGQGMVYREGLWGPLPVLSTNLSALIYALRVPDAHLQDSRLKNHNYVLYVLFFEDLHSPAIEWERVERECKEHLNSLDDLESLDVGQANRLFANISQVLIPCT